MSKTGRNDPCPCGSGRKYKQCCMNAQEAPAAAELQWRRVRRAIDNMAATLLRYGQERYGPALLVDAWEDFCLHDEAGDFPQDTPHMPVFMPWLFFDWLPDSRDTDVRPQTQDGLTLAQAYLRERGNRIDPLMAGYLHACCDAPFSFYDVVSVRPGNGLIVRDIFDGTEIDVSERSASAQMRVGDILFAKIARMKELAMLEALSPVCIPPDRREPVLFVRKRMQRSKRPITQEGLKEWCLDLLYTYHEIVEPILNPRRPQLQNTDGDPFMPHTVVYDIDSPQEAFDALADLCIVANRDELLEEGMRDNTGNLTAIAFDWQKAGNEKHKSWSNTVMGKIDIGGGRLTAEMNSENRALLFRQLMEKRLPGARYRATSIQLVESMLRQAEASPAAGRRAAGELEALNAQPEVRAMLAEEMRRHYREWLDMKIPALGNKTPRQAVKSRDGRELVEGLLLQMERQSENLPAFDPAIVLELREALGLPQKPLL
ncbi:MAG TPA: SEC-C metal-binding domain-containing protein [Candidatus Desulfobacillus sp.]|nr:SEC-C metal-binding domain-containing protein [Candidatus Desulfobacillus sp.]